MSELKLGDKVIIIDCSDRSLIGEHVIYKTKVKLFLENGNVFEVTHDGRNGFFEIEKYPS